MSDWIISLDAEPVETRYQLEGVNAETPETLLEGSWALTVLDQTLDRLREEYPREKGRQGRVAGRPVPSVPGSNRAWFQSRLGGHVAQSGSQPRSRWRPGTCA